MSIAKPAPPGQRIEHGLGTLLRIPYQAMMTDGVEPAIQNAGHSAIRAAHLPVIQALAMNSNGLRSTELAAYARITKQSMGYLVDHLHDHGYVERVPDPHDLRAKVVRLTPSGWAVSNLIKETVLGVEADWARFIGPDRMQELKAILRDLVVNVAGRPEDVNQ